MGEANKTIEIHCSSERDKDEYMHSPVMLVERHDNYRKVMIDIYSHLCKGRERIFIFIDIEQAKKIANTLNEYVKALEKLK